MYNPDLLSNQPTITRDISMFVPYNLWWATVEELIRGNGGPYLRKITLMEVWAHGARTCIPCGINPPPTPAHRRSFLIRLVYQHAKRTLHKAEIKEVVDAIRNSLARAGATLR